VSLGDLLFDAFMYPLEAGVLRRRRRELVRLARGRVLEIGAGTGANLPHYPWDRMDELHLLDISPGDALLRVVAVRGVPVTTHAADAQDLPFPDGSFDTVVATLVFCSIADQARGLREARRVLKKDGVMLFVEHVRPHGPLLRRAVDAASPAWRAVTGSCNLDRETVSAIEGARFAVTELRMDGRGLLASGVARAMPRSS
jgi:ubiquinone/menaquinone biosynthesis C-methylase UbiE